MRLVRRGLFDLHTVLEGSCEVLNHSSVSVVLDPKTFCLSVAWNRISKSARFVFFIRFKASNLVWSICPIQVWVYPPCPIFQEICRSPISSFINMKNVCSEMGITTLPLRKTPHTLPSIFRENRYVLSLLER